MPKRYGGGVFFVLETNMATLLDAVNDIIGSVGESNILALDGTHPLEATALATLERISRRVQSKGWWFNTHKTTLVQDGSGRIPVAANVLSIETTERDSGLVKRGGFLHNLEGNTNVIGRDVEVRIRELVAFENLPETVAQYIQAEAVLQFFKNYDGDGTKLQALAQDVALARIPFSADHIRNSDVNLYTSGETGYNLSIIRGNRYRVRSE
jgi:hypothetical protein